MKTIKLTTFILIIGFITLPFCSPKVAHNASKESPSIGITTIQEYVNFDDGHFSYELVDEIDGDEHTLYVFKMISQKWMSESVVKNPIWWHWVTVIVPDEILVNSGLLFIKGGSHSSKQPDKPDDQLMKLAVGTKSVVSQIHNIPNQPTEFVNDDYGPRKEDELIAYTWRKYLEGGAKERDAQLLARFPMTKAAVKAMDLIEDFTSKSKDIPTVNQFVVTGASKRGWTTWTTGAVDNRVVAIAPIVIDMLNMLPSFQHHWRVYGRWADAIVDYQDEGIMEWQNSKEYDKLVEKVEPFSFRDQLTMPKLLLNATGDQFFIPDSWQFYWDELKGEKYLRYVPNSEHSMRETDAMETLASFYASVIYGRNRPRIDWSYEDGQLNLETDSKYPPIKIQLWQAYNPNARNFQVPVIGRAYQASDVEISPNGLYQIPIDLPESGWKAFFAELTFPGVSDEIPLKLTTGVYVVPDVYPYPAFESKAPKGSQKSD